MLGQSLCKSSPVAVEQIFIPRTLSGGPLPGLATDTSSGRTSVAMGVDDLSP